MELEQDKKNLMELISKLQGVIDRCVEKNEMWETREKYLEDMAEEELKNLDTDRKDDELNNYNEVVDYNASQESVSFGTKVEVKTGNNDTETSDTMLEE